MNSMNKTMLAILRILEKHQDAPLGSRELSRQLLQHGVELTERTVRYHLKIMDEKGVTQVFGKEGRKITEQGLRELEQAGASEKVGFIISKIENLSYQTAFDIDTQRGEIILNVSCVSEADWEQAVRIMRPVFSSPYVMSDRVAIGRAGDAIADFIIPEGMVGLATICSVTINGIFLKAGIPVTSKFGGLLQVDEDGPQRFTSLISYWGSSLDPHLVFIKSRMTSVGDAVRNATGNVLASFREIPIVSVDAALALKEKLASLGIGGVLAVGNPNQPLLEMPVSMDRAGMVVVGGLNPVAALEEAGIATESVAMSLLVEYSELQPFKDALKTAI